MLFCFFTKANSQVTTFNKRLDLGEYAAVFSSLEVTDSCYYVAGIVGDQPTTTTSFFAKMDTLGNELFHTIYQNTEAWVFTLQTNKKGNLVVTPYTWDSLGMQSGVLELDTQGNLLQSHFYYNPHTIGDFIRPENMKITQDSGYVFLFTVDNPTEGADLSILKVDKYGNEEWHEIRGVVPYIETGKGLHIEEDGSIVIGYRKDNISGVAKNFTIISVVEKLDSLGNTIWRYESPSTEQVWGANDLLKTKDGGWVVASGLGSEWPVNAISNQAIAEAYIYKLDSARNFLWGRKFASDSYIPIEMFYKVIELEDSSLMAFGEVERLHPQPNPAYSIRHGRVVKLSPQGDSLWSREYEYLDSVSSQHYIYDAERTHDGGFLIAGECSGTGGGVFQQGWLLKLDGEGCLVPGCHLGLSVLPVGATSRIKLSLYPNPTSDYLNIYYQNRNSKKDLTFSVVDALGRVLDTYTTADISDKTYIFPVQDLASGLYFLEVRQDGKLLETQQFVKE